jgi:hypothetical protein
MAKKKGTRYPAGMDEGRKRVLLIAASILAARKLAQYEGPARVPAHQRHRGRDSAGGTDPRGE